MNEKPKVFTIGHSTHEFAQFLELLKHHLVDTIADVRSTPYSHWQPQFNREKLEVTLKAHGVTYIFLGKELGARSDDPACYEKGRVQYRKLAKTSLFRSGIRRVLNESQCMNIALMCAEKDPLECHRTILVARELVDRGSKVVHILASGELESHGAAMKRLFALHNLSEHDLFQTTEELRDQAYAAQEKDIAYTNEEYARKARKAQQ